MQAVIMTRAHHPLRLALERLNLVLELRLLLLQLLDVVLQVRWLLRLALVGEKGAGGGGRGGR